jgi:hypothetical protein
VLTTASPRLNRGNRLASAGMGIRVVFIAMARAVSQPLIPAKSRTPFFTQPLHRSVVGRVGDALIAMQLDGEVVADLLMFVHVRRSPTMNDGIASAIGRWRYHS